MGDSTSAARISGDDKGLVKYVHIETGLLSENTPAGTFSVGNRIEDASWSGDVLVLKFLEEKNYEEIMDILKKPKGTVAALISRGRKMLFKKFL